MSELSRIKRAVSRLRKPITPQEKARYVKIAELVERAVEIPKRVRQSAKHGTATCPGCKAEVFIASTGRLWSHYGKGGGCFYNGLPDQESYERWHRSEEDRNRASWHRAFGEALRKVRDLKSRLRRVKGEVAREKLRSGLEIAEAHQRSLNLKCPYPELVRRYDRGKPE